MKSLQKITVLAILLGASGLATAQTNETTSNPMERTDLTRNVADDDSGKWGLAGLLGLLGLLGLRRKTEDYTQARGSNTR